jgi:hypothetical protein
MRSVGRFPDHAIGDLECANRTSGVQQQEVLEHKDRDDMSAFRHMTFFWRKHVL